MEEDRKRLIPYELKEKAMLKHDNKKVTTHKVWIAITGLMFITVTIFGLISISFSPTVFDTTVYATAITVSGAIFGSNLVWYAKKSASENQYKLRMSMYEDVVNQRLYFNEEMLKLKQKYNACDEDIEQINMNGEIDEFMDDALNDVRGGLDSSRDDAESPNELQTFTI